MPESQRQSRQRRLTRSDLSLAVAALALLIAATGVTPAEATRAVKKAINADKVNGIAASAAPSPGKLLPLGPDGKFPASVVPTGPRGPRGAEGPKGEQGASAAELTNRAVFRAHGLADQATPNSGFLKVIFGGEDFDPGNVFDPASSEFTAPVDGYYSLSASLFVKPQPSNRVLIQLETNREDMTSRGSDITAADDQQPNITAVMRLYKGDRVKVVAWTRNATTVMGPNVVTWFGGYLISRL